MKALILLAIFILSIFAHVEKTITISTPYAYPEGVEYDSVKGIIFASAAGYGIFNVTDEDTGAITKILNLTFPVTGAPIFGIHLYDGLLYGALNHTSPGLIVANIQNDTILYIANCTETNVGVFFNDVTVYDGKVYLTESLQGKIYQYDSVSNECVLFVEDSRFTPNGSIAGINGIDASPVAGTLIVGTSGLYGALYTVNIGTKTVTKIENITEVYGIDGIYRDADKVIVVNNPGKKVYQLSSSDNWVTAMVDRWVDINCTTVTTVAKSDDGYVVGCLNNRTAPFKIFRIWSTKADNDTDATSGSATSGSTSGSATSGSTSGAATNTSTTAAATTAGATTASTTAKSTTTGSGNSIVISFMLFLAMLVFCSV